MWGGGGGEKAKRAGAARGTYGALLGRPGARQGARLLRQGKQGWYKGNRGTRHLFVTPAPEGFVV